MPWGSGQGVGVGSRGLPLAMIVWRRLQTASGSSRIFVRGRATGCEAVRGDVPPRLQAKRVDEHGRLRMY